jgi:allophanate hydrolase subunit 2
MVLYADVWKVFQAIPGKDTIRFAHATIEEAEASRKATEDMLSTAVVEE